MNTTEDLTTAKHVTETGGGAIGRIRATWPFARLNVNSNVLKLSISLMGTVVFRPSDIVSIEVINDIRGRGIKIYHHVSGYNSNIVFYTKDDVGSLLESIRQTGFLDNKAPLPADVENEIAAIQASGSFPVKTSAAIFFVVVWNLFFIGGELPSLLNKTRHLEFGGARLGLLFAILFCLGVLFVPSIRRLVLKEGRQLSEINGFVCFFLAIATIMFVSFLFVPV